MSKSSKFAIKLIYIYIFCLPLSAQEIIQPKPATEFTKKINQSYLNQLDFANKQDYTDATRGFIAALPEGKITLADGSHAWDLNEYKFLNSDTIPDTINPSLWRIAQLNMHNGLFKVIDRIYQIRGLDLSNMTIIEGDTGLIIFDPLITKETAKAGLDLYYANRPFKPVIAVLYTHSHIDHYGGVRGVTNQADVDSGKVKIIAPVGFMEDAISENIYAGNAMARRSMYQYGSVLARNPQGQVDAGLGKSTSFGEPTLITPTVTINTTGEKLTIDGVDMEFQMAPNTEAPTEMLVYLPQFKALCAAEDLTHTLHNLYTLRGAQVRDASAWWKTINQAIESYGDKIDVVFAQHHWPKWGKENIIPYMESQRDQFKYLLDQSLYLLNSGYKPIDLAETIQVPDAISKPWYNRGYYGSVNHNSKAVYQRYLGWYDSNPANLHPIPTVAAAKKYVQYMGGINALIKQAKIDYAKGEYRWVAEVMKQAVFADPNNKQARELQADAFEQLGYQEENPTWRNEYLMGAYELRNGLPKNTIVLTSIDTVKAMNINMLLDYMGLRINTQKAAGKDMKFNMHFTGSSELNYAVNLKNSVLIYTPNKTYANADVDVTWPKDSMIGILFGVTTIDKQIADGNLKIEGNQAMLQELFSVQDNFDPLFNIVTPLAGTTYVR